MTGQTFTGGYKGKGLRLLFRVCDLKVAAVFAVLLVDTASASSCVSYKAPWLETLTAHAVLDDIKLLKYEQKITELVLEKKSYQAKLRELGVDLKFVAEATEDIGGNFDPAKTIGLSASVDLNFWLRALERNIGKDTLTKIDISISEVEQQQRQEIVSDLLAYSAAQALLEVFSVRESLLETQQEFFELEQANGINRSAESLENEMKLIELSNKSLGAITTIERVLLNLEIGREALKGPIVDFVQGEAATKANCIGRPAIEVIAELELSIARQEARLRRKSGGPNLTSSVSILSDTHSRPESAVGIRLQVPIYSGGARATRDRRLEQSVAQAEHRLKLVRFELEKAKREREALDKLTESSLKIAERRIFEGRRRLQELEERSRLGQSTFSEINARKIELNIQQEAIIRLRKDYYQAIIDYSALIGYL